MTLRTILPAMAALLLAACGLADQPPRPDLADDRAVVAAALADFVAWKDVTYGKHEGILSVDPVSAAWPEATAQIIREQASELEDPLENGLVEAFVERNRIAAPITPLLPDPAWAHAPNAASTWPRIPEGAKATGSLTLPGYSADGSRALLQIHHSWSIHGAIVTYVLTKKDGAWTVTGRAQIVFL